MLVFGLSNNFGLNNSGGTVLSVSRSTNFLSFFTKSLAEWKCFMTAVPKMFHKSICVIYAANRNKVANTVFAAQNLVLILSVKSFMIKSTLESRVLSTFLLGGNSAATTIWWLSVLRPGL